MFSSYFILITALSICVESDYLKEKFHQISHDRCSHFEPAKIIFTRSKSDCISSCMGNCSGVSFDYQYNRCSVLGCQTNTNSTLSKTSKCYVTGDEYCSAAVKPTWIDLTTIKSPIALQWNDKCLLLPSNQKFTFGMDLGRRHLITGLEITTVNLQNADVTYATTSYIPTDSTIDIFKYGSSSCGFAQLLRQSNNERIRTRVNCTPCPVYGQYVSVALNIYQPQNNAVTLCNLSISACVTQYF